jgi:hypothetical protein
MTAQRWVEVSIDQPVLKTVNFSMAQQISTKLFHHVTAA